MRILVLLLLPLLAPDESRVRVEGPAEETAFLAGRAPALLEQVEARLGVRFPSPITLRLAGSDAEFARLAGDVPAWAAAVAVPADFSIAVRLSAMGPPQPNDISSVLRHEFVHLLLPLRLRGARVPKWFEEGLAEMIGGRVFSRVEDLLSPAAATDRLIPLADLAHSFPESGAAAALAYAQGESAVRFLSREHGLGPLLDAVAERGSLEAALGSFSDSPGAFEDRWRDSLAKKGWWILPLAGALVPMLLFVAALLVFAGWLRVRRRARRIYEDLPE
jgi:hypothetical protein